MNNQTYETEAHVVDNHWWFRGRRELFGRVLSSMKLPLDSRIIDIGTSSGSNLLLLKQMGFTNVKGVDMSDEAIRFCAQRDLAPVIKGDACSLPFADGTADFVFATDVIEHLDRDGVAVQEVARVLKPGRYAIITVPAFRILWGLQDEISHHKRRYRMNELQKLIESANLETTKKFYFNFILFFPVFAARLLYRAGFLKGVKNENLVGGPLLNWLFLQTFRLDLIAAPCLKIPFGVSACVIARKPENVSE